MHTTTRRVDWARIGAWIGAPLVAWAIIGAVVLHFLGGCVYAGRESSTTTTTRPDGTRIVEKHANTHYTDSTGVGQKLSDLADGIDWQGLLSNPLVLGLTGGASLGFAGLAKLIHSNGKSSGRAEIRNGRPDPKPSPTP